MIRYRLKEQGIDVVDTVLTNRGLTSVQVSKILNPSMEIVESPYTLKNMQQAVDKLFITMRENKTIVIPIDSDCDGWCSAGQLYHFIRYVLGYEEVMYFFHDNPKAHGFTDYVVEMLKATEADLVIMADGGCGDEDRRKYQTVLDNGADIIILDHHPFEGVYQDEVALVNCHQTGSNTNTNLSGASVVFKFLTAVATALEIPSSVDRYRDLVALSLVSDLMDLRVLENRALLNEGIQEINVVNPFISKLMDKKKIEKYLTIEDLGFSVAPMINATVRMGKLVDKEKVFRSLMGAIEDIESEKRGEKGKGIFVPLEDEAFRIATNLKSAQDKARDKAMDILLDREKDSLENGKVFIAEVTDYMDAEISGLVANKMLDIVKKPVLLIRWDGKKKQFSGSARGLTESRELPSFKQLCLDIGKFTFCSGHENAFGIGIGLNKTKIASTKKEINKEFKEKLDNGDITRSEVNALIDTKIKHESEILVNEIQQAFDKLLGGVEFFTGYEVDGEYNRAIPLAEVKAVAQYEDLWCNNIKAPLFIVKSVKMSTDDIEKIGNATYTFKIGDVKFTKNYGSGVWFKDVTLYDELPFGGDIIADIVCKFRKNKKGYYWCDIVAMKTRENTEEKIDF